MYDKLISIIVPVYNAENTIGTCVDSLVRQSHKLLEIILVDDGSTDNSGKICDELAIKDNRIKVIATGCMEVMQETLEALLV